LYNYAIPAHGTDEANEAYGTHEVDGWWREVVA